jgi:FSR family fosmidomycin resistance protein-like MFS transporter
VLVSILRTVVLVGALPLIVFVVPGDSWKAVHAGLLPFAAGVGGLAYGLVFRESRPRRGIVASLLLAAPLMVLFAATAGSAWGLAALGAFGLAMGATVPLVVTLGQRMIPRSSGMASGLTMGFSWGIGGAAGTLVLAGAVSLLEPSLKSEPANRLVLSLAAGVPLAAAGLAALLPGSVPREVGGGSSAGGER